VATPMSLFGSGMGYVAGPSMGLRVCQGIAESGCVYRWMGDSLVTERFCSVVE